MQRVNFNYLYTLTIFLFGVVLICNSCNSNELTTGMYGCHKVYEAEVKEMLISSRELFLLDWKETTNLDSVKCAFIKNNMVKKFSHKNDVIHFQIDRFFRTSSSGGFYRSVCFKDDIPDELEFFPFEQTKFVKVLAQSTMTEINGFKDCEFHCNLYKFKDSIQIYKDKYLLDISVLRSFDQEDLQQPGVKVETLVKLVGIQVVIQKRDLTNCSGNVSMN